MMAQSHQSLWRSQQANYNFGLSSPDEPKFLGCFSPATTSCCGCSLQNSTYIVAILALAIGCLNFVATITTVPDVRSSYSVTIAVLGFCMAAVQIALGVISWKAASELKASHASHALTLFLVATVLMLVHAWVALSYELSAENREAYIQQIEKIVAGGLGHKLSAEDEARIHKEADTLIRLAVAGAVVNCCILIPVAICVSYVLWSLKVRIQARDIFYITTGAPFPIDSFQTGYYERQPVVSIGPLPPAGHTPIPTCSFPMSQQASRVQMAQPLHPHDQRLPLYHYAAEPPFRTPPAVPATEPEVQPLPAGEVVREQLQGYDDSPDAGSGRVVV